MLWLYVGAETESKKETTLNLSCHLYTSNTLNCFIIKVCKLSAVLVV